MHEPEYWENLTKWINRPPSKAELQERERQETRHRERMEDSQQRIASLQRPYPLYVCVLCYRVDGWLGNCRQLMIEGAGSNDSCCNCLRQGLYSGNVDWEPIHNPLLAYGWLPGGEDSRSIARSLRTLSGPRPPAWTRLVRAFGYASPYDRRSLKEWQRGVATWPERPPLGTPLRVLLAEKTEINAPDGSGRLVVFRSGSYDWAGGRWQRRKLGHRRTPSDLPTVFPPDLPMEQLLAAWDDFQVALDERNYDDWREDEHYRQKALEQKAVEEQKQVDKRDRDKRQRGIAKLF